MTEGESRKERMLKSKVGSLMGHVRGRAISCHWKRRWLQWMLAVFPALADGFPGPVHPTPESVSFPEVPPDRLIRGLSWVC